MNDRISIETKGRSNMIHSSVTLTRIEKMALDLKPLILKRAPKFVISLLRTFQMIF